MNLGRFGIWTFLDMLPAAATQEALRTIESLGFGTVWIPEAIGREAFAHAGLLLAGSQSIVVATGIANIYARDPMAMAAAQKTLAEAYPDRFLLGIGVSHQPMVQGVRGHDWSKPYSYMRAYLDAMDAALFMAAAPASPPERVIGALHPRMLKLSADRAAGAHPYFVTPEHTKRARGILGAGKLLAPEQAVLFETDPVKARAIARNHTQTYTRLPNYQRNLLTLGFTPDDFLEDGGSDRVVDAIVAWGSTDKVVARVQEHVAAGADHVCIQVLDENPFAPPVTQWRTLATALGL
jgi:probable F420-dependent oxidoreductase